MAGKKTIRPTAARKEAKPAPAKAVKAGKSVKGAKAPAVPAPAPAPAKGGRKGLFIALGVVALFALIAAQVFFVARKQASMKFDFTRLGAVVPMGLDDGQVQGARAIVGDKDGNVFFLDHKSTNTNSRLQKLDAGLRFIAKYKPKAPADILVEPSGMDVDSQGRLWVLELNGNLHLIGADLKPIKVVKAPEGDTTAVAVTPDDEVLVAARSANKILVFDKDGKYVREFGAPGTDSGDIATPLRMVASAAGSIVVLEGVPTGLRAKVFGPDFKKRRQFAIDDLPYCDPVLMCIDDQERLFFNDHMGARGIIIYNAKNGKLFGEGKSTEDNMSILAPGALGVNKYTGHIFLNFQPGLVQATLPAPK